MIGATSYRLYWLTNGTVTRTHGSQLANVTSPFVHVGPTNGMTYFYVVTAVNAAGESPESVVVNATPALVDAAPPQVVATRPRSSEAAVLPTAPVILKFSEALNGATVTSSTVTVSGPGGNAAGSITAAGDLVTFTPSSPLAAESVYTVTATTGVQDVAGNALASAFTYTFTTASPAPQNLAVITGNTEATLSWNAVSGATRYLVSRSTTSGGPYADVGGALPTFATQRVLINGTTYYFRVAAITPFGRSAPSAELAVTPTAAGVPSPTGVTVMPARSTALISWSQVTGALSYRVYRSTSAAGPFATVATNLTRLTFFDTGLSPTTEYRYFVQAVGNPPVSPYSTEVTCVLNGGLLSAPAGVTSSAGTQWAQLNWSPVSGATGYVVYRDDPMSPGFIGPIAATSTGLLQLTLTNGSTYDYLVGAVSNGEVGDLAAISVTPGPALAPRPAVIAGAEPRVGAVQLFFDPSQGATVHSLLRSSTSGGPYNVVATGGTDTTGTPGTTYFYVMRAENGGAFAPVSNEVSVASLPAPVVMPPTGVAVTPGNSQLMVSWSPVAGATGYTVLSSFNSGGPYTGASCTVNYDTRCVLSGTNATTSFIVVRANGTGGPSANSAQVSGTPSAALPAAPAAIVAAGNGAIRLTWSPVAGAVSYRVHRRGPTTNWALLASPAGLSHLDLVSNFTAYFYALETVNAAGSSTWSNLTQGPFWGTTRLPAAPTGVVVAPGAGQLMVSFAPSVGATGYNVLSALAAGGPYSQGNCTPSFQNTRCVITSTNATPTFVIVQAFNPTGIGAPSPEVTGTALASLPAAPTATTVQGNGAILHSWPAISGATSFKVFRRAQNTDWAQLPQNTGLSYLDPVRNGVAWQYAFQTLNATGGSAWSFGSALRVASANLTPAPTSVVATAGNLAATISWTGVPEATTYTAYASLTPGGPYTAVNCGAAGDTHCNLSGTTNGTTYYAIVQSTGPAGVSTPSLEIPFTPSSAAPLTPTLSALIGNAATQLTWPRAAGATSYQVNRRSGPGAWSVVGSPAVPIFTDRDVLNGESYTYALQSVAGAAPAAWSPSTSPLVASSSLPLPPQRVTLLPGNGAVTARWLPVVGATGYTARSSSLAGGPYSGSSCSSNNFYETICNLNATNASAVFVALQANSGTPVSVYAGEVTGAPTAMLPVAPSPGATALTMGKIRVSWSASTGATSYRVYRRPPAGQPVLVGETNVLLFEDEGLTSGSLYRFWVQAVNANGPGAWSGAAQAIAP